MLKFPNDMVWILHSKQGILFSVPRKWVSKQLLMLRETENNTVKSTYHGDTNFFLPMVPNSQRHIQTRRWLKFAI